MTDVLGSEGLDDPQSIADNTLILLNAALALAGATLMTSMADTSGSANHANRLYPPLRQSLIRMNHWNFAKIRVALTPDTDSTTGAVVPPVYEFNYQYTFPSDPPCLKIIDYNGQIVNVNTDPTTLNLFEGLVMNRFKIEHGKLLSNDGTALVGYLGDIDNPLRWDGLFYQVVKYWLASELCLAIPKDAKKAQALMGMAQGTFLPQALAVNGQEGFTDPLVVDDLLWGR